MTSGGHLLGGGEMRESLFCVFVYCFVRAIIFAIFPKFQVLNQGISTINRKAFLPVLEFGLLLFKGPGTHIPSVAFHRF